MSNSLDQALNRVQRLFSFGEYRDLDMSSQYIERLYQENGLFYKLLHSLEGSMHMTFSDETNRGKRTHDFQLRKIAKQIEMQSQQFEGHLIVLEIGCGKGYNIQYLAKKFKKVKFIGIDIDENSIHEARTKVEALKNVSFKKMDMDQLLFDPASFHMVYDIETACHTQHHQKLLSNIYALMKEDGVIHLFDVFRKRSQIINNASQQKALNYIELAVGIPNGIIVKDWLDLAIEEGFTTQENNNLSLGIRSGLDRYHKLASFYFNNPLLAKMLNRVIPEKLKLYSISAYLMKYSMELGFQSYEEIILKK